VPRAVELPRTTPLLAEAALELSPRIEDRDPMIGRLRDEDAAAVVEGNAKRRGKLAGQRAVLGNLGE